MRFALHSVLRQSLHRCPEAFSKCGGHGSKPWPWEKGWETAEQPRTAVQQQLWQGNVNQGESSAKAFISPDEVRAWSRQLALALSPGSSKDQAEVALKVVGSQRLPEQSPHSHSSRDVNAKYQAITNLIFPWVWVLLWPKSYGRATAGKSPVPVNLISPF